MVMSKEDFAALGLEAPATRVDPPNGPHDVNATLARACALHPDGLALVDAQRRMTFAELAGEVDAIAELLAGAGVRAGARVAASLGNDCGIVIGFLAAMQLGAVWVGINRILPAADKRFIIEHSGARLLLADAPLAAEVAGLCAEAPCLQAVWLLDDPARDGGWARALAGAGRSLRTRPAVDRFAPAAIMYTSGTTGTPKGVVHSQHNMIVLPAVCEAHAILAPGAIRGTVLPLTITNVMILGPVMAFWNCRPFKFGPSTRIGPMVEWLHAEEIGQYSMVPAMVYDLLESGLALPAGIALGCGGAPLPQGLRDAFRERHGFAIATSYGLTEAPTVVALSHGDGAPEGASGRALPHIDITIRDPEGRALPAGRTGEVCFGPTASGPWAGCYAPPLGYWREPGRTAALLGDGVVHSGDHGWLDDAGWLSIADRSSELILRGGSNVYPAEIERVLHGHEHVADCAVVGRPDPRMGMLTVACVQPSRPDLDLDRLAEELRTMCAGALARYKVPDQWRFLEEFPRNAMGKVIKTQLRAIVTQDAGA